MRLIVRIMFFMIRKVWRQLKSKITTLENRMIYPLIKKDLIIETIHGCYSQNGWCYCGSADSFESILSGFFDNQMRVIDNNTGNILFIGI